MRIILSILFNTEFSLSALAERLNTLKQHHTMSNETKNKWSVIINIALTTITAILSALGFTVG